MGPSLKIVLVCFDISTASQSFFQAHSPTLV